MLSTANIAGYSAYFLLRSTGDRQSGGHPGKIETSNPRASVSADGGPLMPELGGVFMSIIVVLAIGLDSALLKTQSPLWRAAGYVVNVAGSIREVIDHFKAGDFDLVLLGSSIPIENRERLTFLIRSLGSHVPVAFIAESSGDSDCFADATLRTAPKELLTGMRELVARRREDWR
jgi:hypothetical protein